MWCSLNMLSGGMLWYAMLRLYVIILYFKCRKFKCKSNILNKKNWVSRTKKIQTYVRGRIDPLYELNLHLIVVDQYYDTISQINYFLYYYMIHKTKQKNQQLLKLYF